MALALLSLFKDKPEANEGLGAIFDEARRAKKDEIVSAYKDAGFGLSKQSGADVGSTKQRKRRKRNGRGVAILQAPLTVLTA